MSYQTIDGRVVNDAGQVAVAYYQTIPHPLQIGNKEYFFSVNANICMTWIDPEDVTRVLAVTRDCCNNGRRTVYRLEHELHVKRWSGDAVL